MTVVTSSCKVADILVAALDARGTTREEVAMQVGVHPQTILCWMNGSNLPHAPNAERLVKALSLDAVRFSRAMRLDRAGRKERSNGNAVATQEMEQRRSRIRAAELDDALLEVIGTARSLVGLTGTQTEAVGTIIDNIGLLSDEQSNVLVTLVMSMVSAKGGEG